MALCYVIHRNVVKTLVWKAYFLNAYYIAILLFAKTISVTEVPLFVSKK